MKVHREVTFPIFLALVEALNGNTLVTVLLGWFGRHRRREEIRVIKTGMTKKGEIANG